MKKLFLTVIYFTICAHANSQCNLLPNALPGIPLVHQNTNCFNNSGVAFNPNLGLYYGVRAGNPVFPLETWSSTGVSLYDTTAGFDWRGMWWNPTTNQLEGNGFNTFGMWKADLNASGYAMNTGINIFSGMNQPDAQSVGDLDWQAYEVLYYFNDSIYRYSRTTNAFLGSYPITGTPVPTSNLNSTTLMYTGCPGKEIALLDYVNLRVYVYDKATGAYAGMSQLPATAVTTTSFRTSWANCFVWLFDLNTFTWFSYKIFDACATCVPVNSIQNPSICSGDSIFLGGGWQVNGGAYFDTLIAANGCDSIVASVLNIKPASVNAVNLSICTGDSAFIGGGWQIIGGTYIDVLTSANGCDSTITSTLGILPAVTSVQYFTICSGDSIFAGSSWQINNGTYYDTLNASNGCDSIVSSVLNVNPVSVNAVNLSICSGDSIFIGGSWQSTSGTYNDVLTNANGCDSTIASTLTILPAVSSAQNLSICTGDSVFVGGNWQINSGIYYDTLNTTGGCDSILTSTLNVVPALTSAQSFSICSGDSLFLSGSWKKSNGIYYDTLNTPSGCDSIVASTLNILQGTSSVQNLSICNGGSIFIGGGLQSTAGVYFDTLTAFSGCDSILRTNLSISPISVNSKTAAICQGNSVFLAGNWQTMPGIYNDTLTTAAGCDSIISTNLSVDSTPVVDLGKDTTLCEGEILSLNAANLNASFLWQNHSTNPTFIVTQQGTYWLRVSNNCGTNIDTVIVEEKNCNCSIYIPNSFTPNKDSKNDRFSPFFDCGFKEYDFMIFNRWGEKIFETNNSDDSWDGTYMGQVSEIGVYVYLVMYQFENESSEMKYGKVSLIR